MMNGVPDSSSYVGMIRVKFAGLFHHLSPPAHASGHPGAILHCKHAGQGMVWTRPHCLRTTSILACSAGPTSILKLGSNKNADKSGCRASADVHHARPRSERATPPPAPACAVLRSMQCAGPSMQPARPWWPQLTARANRLVRTRNWRPLFLTP